MCDGSILSCCSPNSHENKRAPKKEHGVSRKPLTQCNKTKSHRVRGLTVSITETNL